MTFIHELQNVASAVFETFFPSHRGLLTSEAKEMLSNPEDKKKFLEAINKLRSGKSEKETITLKSGKEFTLTN